MNTKMIRYILGKMLGVEAVLLLLPALLIGVICGVAAYFITLNADLEYEYLYVDKELTVDFLYRVIVKALKVLGIPNHGEEIELLRIDLLKKHGSVCLCDYFHRFSSFLMCVILCSDSYTGGQKD